MSLSEPSCVQHLSPSTSTSDLGPQLAPENDPAKVIAFVKEEPGNFALMVSPQAEGNLDEIILGFALMEHHNRINHKISESGNGALNVEIAHIHD